MIRILVLAALLALAACTSGCASLSPLAVNHKSTPEAQLVQAQAKADFDRALAARLNYCDIRGTLGAAASVSATPGIGFDVSGSFTCAPQPFTTGPATPLSELK